MKKEELRKRFHGDFTYMDGELETQWRGSAHPAQIFDFFWKEIEKLQASEDELCLKVQEEQDEAVRIYNEGEERDKMRLDKISRLESTLEAADEVMKSLHQVHRPNWVKNTEETYELIEKYNQLKAKK